MRTSPTRPCRSPSTGLRLVTMNTGNYTIDTINYDGRELKIQVTKNLVTLSLD